MPTVLLTTHRRWRLETSVFPGRQYSPFAFTVTVCRQYDGGPLVKALPTSLTRHVFAQVPSSLMETASGSCHLQEKVRLPEQAYKMPLYTKMWSTALIPYHCQLFKTTFFCNRSVYKPVSTGWYNIALAMIWQHKNIHRQNITCMLTVGFKTVYLHNNQQFAPIQLTAFQMFFLSHFKRWSSEMF